jgi:hypothetical protein
MLAGLITALLNLVIGAAGAIGALAIASVTKLGDRLIGHKFDERLEAYKGGIQQEIEQLRSRLAHVSDRSVRSNELEYEAITAAWSKFIAAYQATSRCIVRYYEHPDFNHMDETSIDAYLALTKLSDSSKGYLKSAQDKNQAWCRIEDNRLLNEARQAIFETHEVLGTKGIFIPKVLEDAFKGGLDACSMAWAFEKSANENRETDASSKGIIDFLEKGPGIVDALKQTVRERILAAYPE